MQLSLMLPLALSATALAGCGDSADEVRAANAVADAIPAGIYSNVAFDQSTGDMTGIELKLSRGSDSETIEIVDCQGQCTTLHALALRRGMNGLFFELPVDGGQTVPVALEKSGRGVTVNIDRGDGLIATPLVRVDREWGLRVARRQ